MENIITNEENTIIFHYPFYIAWHSYFPDDPKLTEIWDPVPKIVTPGKTNDCAFRCNPSFDGSNLDEWTNEKGEQAGWMCTTVFLR